MESHGDTETRRKGFKPPKRSHRDTETQGKEREGFDGMRAREGRE
jgi:hypothetical protein